MFPRLHTERIAGHDTGNNCRQPVIIFCRAADNGAHLRHIEIFELAPQSIHHQFRSQRLRELIGSLKEFLPQLGWGAVGGWVAVLIYIIVLGTTLLLRWRSRAWQSIHL